MKQMKLLEAIGGVSEQLLMDMEKSDRRRPGRTMRIVLVAALIAALALSGAAVGIRFFEGENSVANIVTGQGRFAYNEDYIYYGETGRICRLDLETGEIQTITLANENEDPKYLFITQTHIGYVEGYHRLVLMEKDGSSQEVILEGDCSRLFVDGSMLYSDNGAQLCRTDMRTGEVTILAENTHGYWVDDTYIYALVGDRGNVFLRSRKDIIDFETITLSFYPTAIYVYGENLFFTSGSSDLRYQVIHYQDGVENALPIYSAFVQRLDNCLIYLDAVEKNVVKSYDLTSGEVTVLQENVYEFSVLEGRYICFDRYNMPPTILDWETGEYIMQ